MFGDFFSSANRASLKGIDLEEHNNLTTYDQATPAWTNEACSWPSGGWQWILGEANLLRSHLRNARQYFDASLLAGTSLTSPIERGWVLISNSCAKGWANIQLQSPNVSSFISRFKNYLDRFQNIYCNYAVLAHAFGKLRNYLLVYTFTSGDYYWNRITKSEVIRLANAAGSTTLSIHKSLMNH